MPHLTPFHKPHRCQPPPFPADRPSLAPLVQEAVDLVARVFAKVGVDAGCDSSVACRVAASTLTRVALVKNSRDNITVVVVNI